LKESDFYSKNVLQFKKVRDFSVDIPDCESKKSGNNLLKYLRSSLIWNFDSKLVGLRAISDPKVGVRAGAVIVQIGDIEGLGVQDADVSGSQAVRQSLEFRQNSRLRNV